MDRLDLGINYGAIATPSFKTEILEDGKGFEQRNPKWTYPLHTFQIGDRTINKELLDYLTAFFMKVRGKSRPFLWKNWSDYKAINQSIGIGDGIKTHSQLVKRYGMSNPLSVPITKPVSGSLSLTVVGINNTAWSLNANTGLVTFSSAPIGAIAASFEFDFLVKSSVDNLNNRFQAIRLETGELAYQIGTITLQQQRG